MLGLPVPFLWLLALLDLKHIFLLAWLSVVAIMVIYFLLSEGYRGLSCQLRAAQQDTSQTKPEEVSIPTDAQITTQKHERHGEARQHDYSRGSKLPSY